MSGPPDSFLENYQQVEAFAEGEAEEYDEETFYVTLDLGQLDPNLLPNATSYRLTGLETAKPFLQIGGNTFRGEHETLIGTEVIFQEPTNPSGASRNFVPLATTDKRIKFREVRLKPKQTSAMDWTAEDEEEAESTEKTLLQQNKTLGGVSREKQAEFFPSSRKGALLDRQKGRRRWRKRPEEYNTSDEETEEANAEVANEGESAHDGDDGSSEEDDDGTMNEGGSVE